MSHNFPIFGEADPETVAQMQAITSHGPHKVALMADHHIGYSVPIGGVVAFEKKICVNGVGFDIACGNKAVLTTADPIALKGNIYRTMNEIQKHISFGIGRKNNEPVSHPLFDEPLWNDSPLLRSLKDKAMEQLGTVGSGNHYVDLFLDERARVWVGVHFGSRGKRWCPRRTYYTR